MISFNLRTSAILEDMHMVKYNNIPCTLLKRKTLPKYQFNIWIMDALHVTSGRLIQENL